MSEEQVPTLDLAQYDSDRDGFVAALGEAYERFGFCGVRNHGVADEIISDAYDAFHRFFALPNEVKASYSVSGGGGARGYTGFGIETAKDSQHPDLKEFWQVGRELADDHPHRDRMPPNRWPGEVADFEERGYRLYEALDDLGRRMLRAMALYLGQDEVFFDDKVNEGNSILRPIHYPPIEDTGTQSVRSGRHEDINLITLLIGAEGPGLEILRRDRTWLPVTTIPGAIVCNIGDMMQRLTNHVFPSTTHRVVNPPGALATQSRYSIPFFLHPNADFMIETLGTCISDDNPNRYPEPLGSHEYLQQRLIEIGLLPDDE
ncbi:MAG: 2-oxoglutarate and iron-dependent oxygenase domain-containing protein [Pseudomonadota bacterium]